MLTTKEIRAAIESLENVYQDDRNPADTVKKYVEAVGIDVASNCIAAMVRHYFWDGRISRTAKDWANGMEGFQISDDWLRSVQDVYSDSIHRAHLSQLAEAMDIYLMQPFPGAENEPAADPEEDHDDTDKERALLIINATPPVSLGELSDIYTEAVAILPAEDIDHHETDLYLRVTDASRGLINRYKYKGSVSKFVDQINGGLWYDIPFAYTPTWVEHWKRTHNIKSIEYSKETGEYTVEYADILDGETTSYTGNTLTEDEKAWAKECKNYHEDKYHATWTN